MLYIHIFSFLVVDPVTELYPDPDFERDTYEAPPPMSPNADVFELLRTMNTEQSPLSEPKPVIPETLLSRLIQRKVPLMLLAIIVYLIFATDNEFLLGSNVFVALMGWEAIEFFLNGRSFRSAAGGGGSYLNILFLLGGIPPQTSQIVLNVMELANKVLRDVAVFVFFFVITHILWSLFAGEILSEILDKDLTSHVEL